MRAGRRLTVERLPHPVRRRGSHPPGSPFHLVTLGPIANLLGTTDENSNSEAAERMRGPMDLTRTTGAAAIAAHQAGKEAIGPGSGGGNYGRGASARLGAADVGIVLRARSTSPSDGDDTHGDLVRDRFDVCRLKIVKDRNGWFGLGSKYLRMVGHDRFELATHADWKDAGKQGTSESRALCDARAQDDVVALLADGEEHNRAALVRSLKKSDGLGRPAVENALVNLRRSRVITHRKGARGADVYRLARQPSVSDEYDDLYAE